MNALVSVFAQEITRVNSAGIPTALVAAVLIVFFHLLFVMFTIVQARSQGNANWWIWGLITLAAPLLGYLIWRFFGAKDDGSPGQLLPRRKL